jgi:hypothetical protein
MVVLCGFTINKMKRREPREQTVTRKRVAHLSPPRYYMDEVHNIVRKEYQKLYFLCAGPAWEQHTFLHDVSNYHGLVIPMELWEIIGEYLLVLQVVHVRPSINAPPVGWTDTKSYARIVMDIKDMQVNPWEVMDALKEVAKPTRFNNKPNSGVFYFSVGKLIRDSVQSGAAFRSDADFKCVSRDFFTLWDGFHRVVNSFFDTAECWTFTISRISTYPIVMHNPCLERVNGRWDFIN